MHNGDDIEITKNGYIYIYVSNSSNIPMFFDNLFVTQTSDALMEETHYYPFGLTMAGISSKAAGSLENKYKYNGNEIQNKDFSDGSGLESYDANFRQRDAQTGRWWQLDPMMEAHPDISPYAFVNNNPCLYSDPLGLDTVKVQGNVGQLVTVSSSNGAEGTWQITPNGTVGKGMSGEGEEVVVTSKLKHNTPENQSGLPLAFIGFAGSWGETKMFNKTTWYSIERMRSYNQGFHSNQYTSPKAKPIAKNISKGLRYFGWGLGLLNQFQIFGDDKISGQQQVTETASNVYSTFGGIYGAAWGIGWEMGRGVSSNQSYRENIRPLLQKYLLGGMDQESKWYEKLKEINRFIDAIEVNK
jgi:RHS repeat-associated protein